MANSLKTRILNKFRLLNQLPFVEKWLVSRSLNNDAFARKFIGSNYLYRTDTVRRCARRGINYELHINDYLDHGIYFGFRDSEDFNRDSLMKLVRVGDVVFDIGANMGDTALHIAQILDNKGTVYAFEPSPGVFKRLKKNVDLNSFTNLKLYNVAMGDTEGELSFIGTKEDHTGGAFVSKEIKSDTQVKVLTLDGFVQQNGISHIDLIKIDTEGFEFFIVKGGEKTLRKLKPKIFMEVSDSLLQRAGSSAKQLIAFMESLQYRCYHAETGETVTPDFDFFQMHFDVVCKAV
jgi:FkbM family methyltransferase